MTSPTVTNTFSGATTISSSQVNQNFTDIINALTDGSKSFSIDALTCASAATLNGNVTLGSSSSKTLTVNAVLSSTIAIGANNTYDIGAATLALAGIYLGAPSSRSTRLTAHQSLGASNTLVLPNGNGTANFLLKTDGSGNTAWIQNFLYTVQIKTTTYSVLSTDDIIYVSTASGWTLTLPTPIGITGKVIKIVKTSGDFNVLTIATAAASIVEFGSTVSTTTVNTQGEYVEISSDGTNWEVTNRKVDGPWTTFTPTLSSSTNTSISSCMYRRIGQGVQVKVKINWTGNGGAGTFTCTIPSGLTADTGLIDASANTFDGSGFAKALTARAISCNLGTDTTNAYSFRYIDGTGTSVVAGTDMINGYTLAFIAWAPISGWKY